MRAWPLLVVLGFALAPACTHAQSVTGDIVFERKGPAGDDVPPAIFQHWLHRVQYKCYACHNAKVGFTMKAGAETVTMDAIESDRYCGACHNGRVAFPVNFNTCIRCHRK